MYAGHAGRDERHDDTNDITATAAMRIRIFFILYSF